jgi:WD40-like Beta Propeller Repeat
MVPRWTLPALLLAATCGPPPRDPIATQPPQPGTFTFPYVDPAVPGAPAVFTGPAGAQAGAPQIVYPLDSAMHPINIGQITLQWSRGAATSRVFRFALAQPDGTRYELYAPCTTSACTMVPPPAAWLTIARLNLDGRLTATVEGTDGAGGPVYRSPPIEVRFSPDAVAGGLYYWTQGDAGGTTYRLPFGAVQATPFIVPRSATNPMPCGGCHSVSRDGKVISFSATGDDTSMGVLIAAPTEDPTRPTVVPDASGAGIPSRFTALNSNGSRVLLTTYGQIRVLDTATGQPVDVGDPTSLLPHSKLVTHPEWSPTGTRVAFTMYTGLVYDKNGAVTRTVADTRPSDGEIVTMAFDPVTGHLGDLRVIVPMASDGLFHFYPTWSPDERWLVFASGPLGVSAYAAPDARLRLASADIVGQACPGPTCFELAKASQGTVLSSTWPKISPISLVGDSVLFVTFSSKMNYGSILLNTGPNGANRAQLWMAAVDLRGLAAGIDPSLPPIWLPFQDVTQANHLPFWTAIVACTNDGISYARCGDGEICTNGQCVPVVP